ncbi:hypothetical protein FQN60_004664 [Etheostoma spectabile]|uniref:Uncharacterized protein n=1 Tax=Etheostoma spectabile TaxID=54343 RepID=A0A5J5DKV9_9PERO|nr:hypothetical protein FQN60_004664 [Etheostoma spectabile]
MLDGVVSSTESVFLVAARHHSDVGGCWSIQGRVLLSCSSSFLPVPRFSNPSVPLMGAKSDSSATFPSSSPRTSLHP